MFIPFSAMACEIKLWWVVLFLLVVSIMQRWVHGDPQVPCYFIFGDSLSDNGNNNELSTLARVNYKPYGIDFPDGPTGRFSNGRNVVDFIAENLGFDHHIPPFATTNGWTILQGVNYASGSAGIRDETAQHLGQCISLKKQLQNHQTTISNMVEILGNKDSAMKHLNKCLYSVGIGSNDYLNNYFLPEHYSTNERYSLNEYAKVLVDEYSMQLMTLYNYGARKIALAGLAQIGCIPRAIQLYGTNSSLCFDNLNKASQLFNEELKSLVDQLNHDLDDVQFIYINNYEMGEGDPTLLGFKVLNSECCKVRNDGQCCPNQKPCSNRTEYLFWDSFHPTEAVNKMTAARMYSAFSASDCYPFDIRHLALLNIKNLSTKSPKICL